MNLHSFLLVVVSLSCGSLPSREVDLSAALLATCGMVAAWWILCHVAARTTAQQVRAGRIDPLSGAHLLEKQLDAFRWLGLGVIMLCLGGFGLAAGLQAIPLLTNSVFLQSLVLLFPGLALASASWSAEHRYGVLMSYADRGLVTHAKAILMAFRGGLAWLIVPILFLLAIVDLVSMLQLDSTKSGILLLVTVVLFVCVGVPWLVSRLFRTEPVDGATAQWIAAILLAAGLRKTRVRRWQTSGGAFNAVIVGFIPPLRTLLLSDRLLDELPRQQIAMVVLHEAAHLRRRHVPIRMLSVLPAWGIGALVTHYAQQSTWAMAAGSVAAIGITMLILRLVAYRTEYDADVNACHLAEKISESIAEIPPDYDAAAQVLSEALIRVTIDSPTSRKATWLHPGVVDRIAFMRRKRSTLMANTTTATTIVNPA